MKDNQIKMESLSLSPRPDANLDTQVASPTPPIRSADSPIVIGDEGETMMTAEEGVVLSDGGIEKITGPPTQNQAAPAVDTPTTTSAAQNKDHEKEEQ